MTPTRAHDRAATPHTPVDAQAQSARQTPAGGVSVVLHGCVWPAAADLARLQRRLREVWPDAEIVEAREDAAQAIGAAAAINRAAAGTRGAWLVLLESSVLPEAAGLQALRHEAGGITIEDSSSVDGLAHDAAQRDRPAVPAFDNAGTLPPLSAHGGDDDPQAGEGLLDQLARLREQLSAPAGDAGRVAGSASVTRDRAAKEGLESLAGGPVHDHAERHAAPAHAVRCLPIVALPRAQWTLLGGLDERLWSVGVAEDLAARARISGVPVRVAPIAIERRGAPAWPLAPHIARVLRTRSRLITALKTAPPEALGARFAHEATQALLESWRATGFTEETFRFGGTWGRRSGSLAARLRGQGGADEASTMRDPAGVLVPLLAIDAALECCQPLLAERARWTLIAREHARTQRDDVAANGPSSMPFACEPSAPKWRRAAAEETAEQTAQRPHTAQVDAENAAGIAAAPEQTPTQAHTHARAQAHVPIVTTPFAPQITPQLTTAAAAHAASAHAASAPHRAPAAADGGAPLPFVSVIIVNWNGREHLQDCFGSLSASDYPADRRELICVDNGSKDDSVAFLRASFPAVRIVALDTNRGFTGGNEAGVAIARGDVLVFLNNDMRVEPDCLRELVKRLEAGDAASGAGASGTPAAAGGGAIACVGARVLSWDGRRIDFIRGSVNFEARGFQDFYAAPNTPDLATPADTFFPNGGAFAVTREAYDRAGGFDPAFFAYYDDVDLGWRLRIAGAEPRVAGRAVAYHRHGATARTQPQGQKRFLMERNAVWTMMKNYGEPALRRAFGPALALHVRRLLDETTIDRRAAALHGLAPFVARLRRPREQAGVGVPAAAIYVMADDRGSDAGWRGSAAPASAPAASELPGSTSSATASPASVSAAAVSGAPGSHGPRDTRGGRDSRDLSLFFRRFPVESLAGAGAALDALPRLLRDRARVQAARRVDDAAILPRFGRALDALSPFSSYSRIQHALMDALDLPAAFRSRSRLLIISPEPVGRNMSGPSARVLEMGRSLSDVCRVTIATPGPVEVDDPRVTIASFSRAQTDGLRRLAEDADVILIQGFALALYPFLKVLGVPIVADLYCPFTIEYLEMKRAEMLAAAQAGDTAGLAIQQQAHGIFGAQNDQLAECDFFICASERQRDFWIGALHSTGRLNPLTYTDDPTLRRLIDVVPFGLSDEPAEQAAARAARAAVDDAGGAVMRGVWPGIGPDDRILLWAGSMLDWQDPLAVIEAVGLLARTHPDVRLVFMGTRHPNPDVPPMRMVSEGRALAERLGLLDRHVFFNDWVPYEQRARFLIEADLGVSTHTDHLETHFSFRTRMLDYVWAGLPIVCTRGDFFADLVRERQLGRVVPPNDVPALAAAIASLLDDGAAHAAARAQLAALRAELTWSRSVEPLRAFCASPRAAADRAPELIVYRQRLEQQFRGSRWLRRTALGLGLSEQNLERLKRSRVVRAAMVARNQLAMRRARRG